jgi:CBS domain-containing protein
MKLIECMTTTSTATSGMTVRDALKECVKCDCPGIPFVDESGKLVGRFSIRHTFYQHCIPADLIKHAHLLGNDIDHIEMEDQYTNDFLSLPASDFILKQILHLNPNSQIVKALALMEQFDTSYLFVVDENERYLGVVTHQSIARHMLEQ